LTRTPVVDFRRMTALLGLTREELRAVVASEGEPSYRADQLADWLYGRGIRTLDEMTTLPLALRHRLGIAHDVGRSRILARQQAGDGTLKLLLELHDGERIETVGLPYADRVSCCVSTQVGCSVGCVFCATGMGGFVRNLTAGEIVEQVITVQQELRAAASDSRVDHVALMGMGEPLLNYEATLKAVRLLNSEVGIAMRNLTVSTAGFLPGISRLAREKLQLTLAVSLHAATDDVRATLMPGAARWSVAEVVAASRDYVKTTGRRVTFEYCLIDRVNDDSVDAERLAALLRGVNCHVNLIPLNTVAGLPYRSPSRERILAFRAVLQAAGIEVTQRAERGSDIHAACGQLRRRA
jgi:23S rRNA (adenine2503-C2)-methyltransferase